MLKYMLSFLLDTCPGMRLVDCLFNLVRNKDFLGGTVVKTLPSSAGGVGSIPGQGVNQIIKQKQYCNKCNKDLKIHIKNKQTTYL